jgi:hypothetical protein
MNRYLVKLDSLDEKRAYPSNPQNPQNPPKRGFEGFEGSPSSAFLPLAIPPTELSTGPYASSLATLRAKCPAYVDQARWQQAIKDAEGFVAAWGEQAEALGWTDGDLFGLPELPDQPRADHDRLRRVDALGLCWLLRSRRVIELTAEAAVIRTDSGGTLRYYRKRTLPADTAVEIATVTPGAPAIGKRATP